jgi:four helix bundle protein
MNGDEGTGNREQKDLADRLLRPQRQSSSLVLCRFAPQTVLRSFAEEEKSMGESFKDLLVWQRAVQMTVAIYNLTASFPPGERFGLTNQLRRASVSVASNIAEGYGRSTRGEYVLFLGHARGSTFEVQTQLVIAEALGYGTAQTRKSAESLSIEVSRMIVAIMTKLRK